MTLRRLTTFWIARFSILAFVILWLNSCTIIEGITEIGKDEWERSTGLRWPEERLSVNELVFHNLGLGLGSARDINTYLKVVGERENVGAFWQLNREATTFIYTRLPRINEDYLESLAYSINSRGQIVGQSRNRIGTIASIWRSFTSIPSTPDFTSPSTLHAINERQVAVGTSNSGGPPGTPVNSASRWVLPDLVGSGSSPSIYTGGTDRYDMTVATDLTNHEYGNEIIIGYVLADSRETAWVRTRQTSGIGSRIARFNVRLDNNWRAMAINDRGLIVGGSIRNRIGYFSYFDITSEPTRDYRPAVERLLPLPIDVGESGPTIAYDVNNGSSRVSPLLVGESRGRAVAWVGPDALPVNLNTNAPLGWVLTKAYGVNNMGVIVGEGVYDGQIRAFLLSPFEFDRL